MGLYRLFVSHSHKDKRIALAFVAAIEAAMKTVGGVLCTSNRPPEYSDPNVEDVSDLLHDHLEQSACVVGILTPNSLDSAWCLFELGGAWMRAKRTFPLYTGIVTDNFPAALKNQKRAREAVCLNKPEEVSKVFKEISIELGWKLTSLAQEESEQLEAIKQLEEFKRLIAVINEFQWKDLDKGHGQHRGSH